MLGLGHELSVIADAPSLVSSVVSKFVRDRPGEMAEFRALARRPRVQGAVEIVLVPGRPMPPATR